MSRAVRCGAVTERRASRLKARESSVPLLNLNRKLHFHSWTQTALVEKDDDARDGSSGCQKLGNGQNLSVSRDPAKSFKDK